MAKYISIIVCAFILFINDGVSAQCNISEALTNQFELELGVREATGNNDGVKVEEYLRTTGLGKGYPWCAAFVYWNFIQLGYTVDIEYPAWTPSYFTEERVIYTRGEGFKCQPMPGDVIGIYFRSKGRIAHVGFIYEITDKYYITIEGNTNSAGSREGDGVMKKYRPKNTIYKISRFF